MSLRRTNQKSQLNVEHLPAAEVLVLDVAQGAEPVVELGVLDAEPEVVVAEVEGETVEVVVAEAECITTRKAIPAHRVAMTKVIFSAIIAKSMGIMHMNLRTHEKNEPSRTT